MNQHNIKTIKQKEQRQSNIELLRILAIMGVLVLHYNNIDIGGGFGYVKSGSMNYFTLILFESIAVCAVNLFFMISGYFMVTSNKRSIRKPIELIVQVVIYSVIGYVLVTVFTHGNISFKSLIGNLIPANYFVIFYCVLYFVSPYLNRLIDMLDKKQIIRLLIVLIVLFSVYCTLVQILCNIRGEQIIGLDSVGLKGSQNGYNIVNFTLMYFIGAFIRKYQLHERFKKKLLLGVFIVSILLIFFWALLDMRNPNILSKTAWIYCNPLVIIEAAMLLLLFLNIDIGSNKIINALAKSVFSVFLLHGYFITRIGIEKYVQSNCIIMIIHIIVSIFAIYCVCSIIHFIYSIVTTPIFNKVFLKKNFVVVDLETKE